MYLNKSRRKKTYNLRRKKRKNHDSSTTIETGNFIQSDNSDNEDQLEDVAIESDEVCKIELSFDEIKSSKIIFEMSENECIVVSKLDLECLNGENYLNDKIIEFYLNYIKTKLISPDVANKTYIFNSFFFSKMICAKRDPKNDNNIYEHLYKLVEKWTKNVDIFEYNHLIIPIFKDYHWSLAIVCNPGQLLEDKIEEVNHTEKPCLIFMDSMGKMKCLQKYTKYIRNFLENEAFERKNVRICLNNQSFPTLNPPTPLQTNEHDCGIFLLHYVELYLKDPNSIFENCKRLSTLTLRRWFNAKNLAAKRIDIAKILTTIYYDNKEANILFPEPDIDEFDISDSLGDDDISVLLDESDNIGNKKDQNSNRASFLISRSTTIQKPENYSQASLDLSDNESPELEDSAIKTILSKNVEKKHTFEFPLNNDHQAAEISLNQEDDQSLVDDSTAILLNKLEMEEDNESSNQKNFINKSLIKEDLVLEMQSNFQFDDMFNLDFNDLTNSNELTLSGRYLEDEDEE